LICRLFGRWWIRFKSVATGLVILLHVLFIGEGASMHAIDNLLALLISLSQLSKLQQMPGLDLEQAALDGDGAPPYRHGLTACMTMDADRVSAVDALARGQAG
jgi:hypothetical protein